MADVNLKFEKDTTLSDRRSTTYSTTKTVGEKSCTIFVNDITKNGFGKKDRFMYKGDISLFSQKEIQDLISKGVDDKPYNAGDKTPPRASFKTEKVDECKEIKEGHYYGLGDILDCSAKGVEAEEKAQAEAKAKTDAEAAAKAKVEADAKAAEAAKTAPPATPAATEKPAAAKAEKPIPPPPAQAPEQNYNQEYYQQQWAQPVSYGPSPAEMMGTSALAGGAIGGILGFLFGGSRGFFSGAFGGALGGLMGFCGMSGMSGMGGAMIGGGFDCGGFGMGPDPTDAALNMTFANFFNSVSSPRPYIMPALQSQSAPATPVSNLPELTDKNFDETIKNSKTPVVVDFYADWCGPCKEQSPIVDEIAKDYSGKAQVYKVNVDKAQGKTDEYKVEKIPTILVFQDGKVVERLVSIQTKEKLAEVLNKYTPKEVAENK